MAALTTAHWENDVGTPGKRKPGLIAKLIFGLIVAVTGLLIWLLAQSLSPPLAKDRMAVPAPPPAATG